MPGYGVAYTDKQASADEWIENDEQACEYGCGYVYILSPDGVSHHAV